MATEIIVLGIGDGLDDQFTGVSRKTRPSFCSRLEIPPTQRVARFVEFLGIRNGEIRRPTVFGLDQFDRNLRDEISFMYEFGFRRRRYELTITKPIAPTLIMVRNKTTRILEAGKAKARAGTDTSNVKQAAPVRFMAAVYHFA